jgi:(p)ppGpp synthase/HD superfamily hydrolase
LNATASTEPIPGIPEPPRSKWRYSERLLRALDVAARMHAGQSRKGTDVPYLSHLLGACAIAFEHGANEDQAIAALLHDAIEDVEPAEQARAVVATFGPEVLRIVLACSDGEAGNKGAWRERKEAYIARIATEDAPVLLVSASDKLHNARAIVADLRVHGAAYLDRFTGGRDGTLCYYRALVDAFAANPAHHPALVAELALVVDEMRVLAANAAPVSGPDPSDF